MTDGRARTPGAPNSPPHAASAPLVPAGTPAAPNGASRASLGRWAAPTWLVWLAAQLELLSATLLHFVSLALAIPFFGAALILSGNSPDHFHLDLRELGLGELLRMGAALFVNTLLDLSLRSGDAWILALIPLLDLSLIGVVAWLNMPFVNSAESRGTRYLRSARITLLSALVAVPAAALLLALTAIERWVGEEIRGVSSDVALSAYAMLWLLLAARWVALACGCTADARASGADRARLVAAASDAGAATARLNADETGDGVALCCPECGYLLVGSDPRARCPECGTAEAGARAMGRVEPAWAIRASPCSYVMTVLAVSGQRGFFSRLSVHGSRRSCVSFAWWNCVAAGALLVGGLVLALIGMPWIGPDSILGFASRLSAFGAAVALLAWILLLLLVWRGSALALGDSRRAVPAACYGTALFLPMAALLSLSVGLHARGQQAGWFDRGAELPLYGFLGYDAIAAMLLALPPFVAMCWGLVRLRAAFRGVRHA